MSASTTGPRHRWWRTAFVFCLIGVVIAFSTDALLWRGLRRVRQTNVSVWRDLVTGRIGSEVLIVGGSRALVGVDCEILGRRFSMSCFNLGLDGSPANLQRPYVETYLLHNPAPRLAIFVVDVGSLAESGTPYDLAQYLAFLDERPIKDGLSRYIDVWKYRYIPLYAFSQLGLNQVMLAAGGVIGQQENPASRRIRGYQPSDVRWDGSFEAFAAAGGSRFAVDPVGLADATRMISLLESRGARVVLVFSPEWQGARPLEINRDELMRTYAAMAADHHARFLDYSNSPLARDRSLFYNSQHMNRRGATAFTAVLANDLADLPPR